MNRSLMIRRLCWKELRQLLPLAGLLVLVGTLLQGMAMLLPLGGNIPWRDVAALLGMPGLFAAGAGALLVGQEKETRTLDWLRSLPLPASYLVWVKLLIGLVGLLSMWAFSFVLGWATGTLSVVRDGSGSEWLWPLHSLFLMFVGFATAWKVRSSMVALLLVLPLACLPLLFANLHQVAVDWSSGYSQMVTGEPSQEVMGAYLILFAVGFAWYSWHSGLSILAPAKVSGSALLASAAASVPKPTALSFHRVSPAPALVWQFAVQNRAVLIGLVVLQLAFVPFPSPLVLLATLVVISWLGAIVFQSDLTHRRGLFLADRGLSPRLVWTTRHILPLSLMLTLLCAAVLYLEWMVDEQIIQVLDATVYVMLGLGVLGIYLATQWFGQVAKSPIVSAIAAPLLGAMVVGYFGYCIIELGASWWSVGVALVIPLLATWLGTRDWMDFRRDRRMWWRHAALAALFCWLPASSFLFYWATFPRMSSGARDTLQLIALDNMHFYGPLRELTIPRSVSWDSAHRVNPQSTMESIRASLDEDAWGVRSADAQYLCIAQAVRVRLAESHVVATQNQATEETESKAMGGSTAEYRAWLRLLMDIHDRLRKNWRLLEQDQADVIEMWMVEELKASGAKARLGDDLIQRLYDIFNNPTTRQTARLRGIALSWKFQTNEQLGGYSLHDLHSGYVTTRQAWTASRTANVISELLLRELQAYDQSPINEKQLAETHQQKATLLGRSLVTSGDVYLEDATGQRQLLYFETRQHFIPGRYWHGAWERDGADLSASLSN